MKKAFILSFILMIISCSKNTINVKIETDLGDIIIELYPDKASKTVENFMYYVDGGHYTNSSFYRVTTQENEATREFPIEVIQGGNVPKEAYIDPITIEMTDSTKVKHVNGAISMARGGPHTATSHFFICIGNQPELDHAGKRNPDGYGFAAFGKVISGMDIVKKIQSFEEKNQYLVNSVRIEGIVRID